MVLRVLLVVLVVALAFGAVAVGERWWGRATGTIPVGLTLVTTSSCHECAVAVRRFETLGITYRTMDAQEADTLGVHSFTVPYAVVGAADGDLVMIRRGKTVAADAGELAEAAAGILV